MRGVSVYRNGGRDGGGSALGGGYSSHPRKRGSNNRANGPKGFCKGISPCPCGLADKDSGNNRAFVPANDPRAGLVKHSRPDNGSASSLSKSNANAWALDLGNPRHVGMNGRHKLGPGLGVALPI